MSFLRRGKKEEPATEEFEVCQRLLVEVGERPGTSASIAGAFMIGELPVFGVQWEGTKPVILLVLEPEADIMSPSLEVHRGYTQHFTPAEGGGTMRRITTKEALEYIAAFRQDVVPQIPGFNS